MTDFINIKIFLLQCSYGNLELVKKYFGQLIGGVYQEMRYTAASHLCEIQSPPKHFNQQILNIGIANALTHNNISIADFLYDKLTSPLCINNIIYRFSISANVIKAETYSWVFSHIKRLDNINMYCLEFIQNNEVVLLSYMNERLRTAILRKKAKHILRTNKIPLEFYLDNRLRLLSTNKIDNVHND